MPTVTSFRRRIGVLLAMTILAYANAFSGTFQFDDFAAILEDRHLQDLPTFLSHLDHTVRPFLKLTFFIDRLLYGENPAGYHLLNLLLHLGSGLLLYRILSDALPRIEPGRSPSEGLAALPFWTVLLFLVHPVGTETVTYLSGRATGLMAFFYLAALYLFVRSTEPRTDPAGSFLRYLAALLCFVLSLLSKETAITLPAALLLWEIVLRRRGGAERRPARVRFHLPFWGILLLFLWIGLSHPRYSFLLRHSLGLRPLYENLLTQINTVTYALSLFVLPTQLNFDHDLSMYRSVLQWPTPLSLAILSGMTAAALLYARKVPFVAFGILWFFLHLVPTNSVLPRSDLLSERNLYLPSIGLFLAVVSLSIVLATRRTVPLEKRSARGLRIAPFGRRAVRSLPFLIAVFLLFSTVNRNAIYGDQVTFWSDAVRKSPHKARPRNNLGYAYYLAGDLDRAIVEFRIALSLDRDYPRAQENLLRAWTLKKSRPEQKQN